MSPDEALGGSCDIDGGGGERERSLCDISDDGEGTEAGIDGEEEEEEGEDLVASRLTPAEVDQRVGGEVEERGEEGDEDLAGEGEEEEDGGVVDDVVDDEQEDSLENMNWTILTPDISCLQDTVVSPDTPEGEQQQARKMSPKTSSASSLLTDSIGGEGGSTGGEERGRSMFSGDPVMSQLNFDQSSSASSCIDLSSSAHPHLPPQTPYYTPSSPPPCASSIYYTAPLPHPSSPSHSSTPSPPSHHTHPHHSHTPLHSIPSSHVSISSSPPLLTHTSVIILGSSDEEDADDKLENS